MSQKSRVLIGGGEPLFYDEAVEKGQGLWTWHTRKIPSIYLNVFDVLKEVLLWVHI